MVLLMTNGSLLHQKQNRLGWKKHKKALKLNHQFMVHMTQKLTTLEQMQILYLINIFYQQRINNDWKAMIISLNDTQYQLHQFLVAWANSMLLSPTGQKPNPFHIFLTGGAGVGKSFLVRTIVQTVKRLFQKDNQIDDVHIWCVHQLEQRRIILLDTHATLSSSNLSGERLASMKETVGDVKLIIIDEISMVSADMLLTIHRLLCDIMGNDQPFGGVSIVAVGDLLQLPPVLQKAVYSLPSDPMASIYGSLWTNQFQIVELTEIQRQKNDVVFAELLNRVRVGSHTEEDIKLLQSRIVPVSSEQYPGKTESTAAICSKGTFFSGRFYTAISRLQNPAGLHFIGEISKSIIKTNDLSLREIIRMKETRPFTPTVPMTLKKTLDVYLKLQLLNINSIKPHMERFYNLFRSSTITLVSSEQYAT
ncbi:LOW QUALITY PROTEIN: PIF1-like protein [Mya arenaria]|uniref:ATP-dependent DNA helicase n=1 Tax=Mya arenaria TaxID=6604 RepID=A0ABY7FYR8_MYAAR|nr:LOW QUALITY PROTEIN: PIF1-like protein [Mya arenaria]